MNANKLLVTDFSSQTLSSQSKILASEDFGHKLLVARPVSDNYRMAKKNQGSVCETEPFELLNVYSTSLVVRHDRNGAISVRTVLLVFVPSPS